MPEHHVVHPGHSACSLGLMHEGYIPDFLVFASTPQITRDSLMPPIGLSEEEKWARNFTKHTAVAFAVLHHETESGEQAYRYIGYTGIHSIRWPDGTGTTGTLLGNSADWLRGYGTEAKLLLLHHAFHVLGLRKLTSEVKAYNARSLGHLIKCGYRIVGRYTQQDFHNGKYLDRILLEVFRADWEPIWETYQTTHTIPKLTDEQRKMVGIETGMT